MYNNNKESEKGGIKVTAKLERREASSDTGVYICRYRNLVNLPHRHNEHELIHINIGPVTLMTANGAYTLDDGNSAFVHGGEIHCMRSDRGSDVSVMKIDPALIRKAAGKKKLLSPVIESDIPVIKAFDEIIKEQNTADEFSGIISGSIVLRLAAEIFRQEKTTEKETNKSEANEKYKELIEMISERYAVLTFEEAADIMCFSKPYFSKFFHRAAGMTFSEYLNTVRVSAAMEMISEGRSSMTDIAIKCGFGTIRSFNRVFRELTGYSPSSLPKGYVFIGAGREEGGFDPTLGCTERINV